MRSTVKTCLGCGAEKPLDEFSPRPTKDGRYARCRPCERLQRRSYYRANEAALRAYKAQQMRRRRADPVLNERIAESRAKRYADGGIGRQRAYTAKLRVRRFFHWRARLWRLRYHIAMTAIDLARLWRSQRGRCALTARKLGRDAQLDHVIHASAGGSHSIDNLRWLDPVVNAARGALTDAEFIALCREVCAQA